MTFNTEKNKIFKIWNNSVENQFQITILSDNDKIVLSKIQGLNNTNTVYNNIIDLSSGWVVPETIIRDTGEPTERIWKLFKEYTVEINNINKNIIPYITSKISYRLGDSAISVPIPDAPNEPGTPFDEEADFETNDVVQVNDTQEENMKNVIYRSSIYLKNIDGLPAELQLKFYLNLVNPNYYQSS